MIFGNSEDLARGFLVPDGGVAGADSQVCGGGRPRDVGGAAPYCGQGAELLTVGDDDELPVLPVARGGRAPARLGDPTEIGVGHRIGPVGPDIATSTDGVPGFHEQTPLRLAMSSFSTEILHEYWAGEHACRRLRRV